MKWRRSYDAAETVEAISASASGCLPSSWSIAFVSPPPPPRLGLHLSTGRWLVCLSVGLGGATGDATVGLWVELGSELRSSPSFGRGW